MCIGVCGKGGGAINEQSKQNSMRGREGYSYKKAGGEGLQLELIRICSVKGSSRLSRNKRVVLVYAQTPILVINHGGGVGLNLKN